MNALSAEWQNFFVAELGALAALTGLLVVAISINLSRILAAAQLPRRAGESLILLVGALVIASLALVPEQPIRWLGVEIFSIGLLIFFTPIVIQVRDWSSAAGVNAAKKTVRLVVGWVASLPFVVGGSLLIFGLDGGLRWVAAGVIASLVAGVLNAWILLVEILR